MVAAKPVEIGPEVDGLRVIRAGLAPTDRVVINGYQFARPGTKAETKAGKIVADAPEKATAGPDEPVSEPATDRKSVREGKSVEGRVDLGGSRIIKKKNT